jgi:hypothetical protein
MPSPRKFQTMKTISCNAFKITNTANNQSCAHGLNNSGLISKNQSTMIRNRLDVNVPMQRCLVSEYWAESRQRRVDSLTPQQLSAQDSLWAMSALVEEALAYQRRCIKSSTCVLPTPKVDLTNGQNCKALKTDIYNLVTLAPSRRVPIDTVVKHIRSEVSMLHLWRISNSPGALVGTIRASRRSSAPSPAV